MHKIIKFITYLSFIFIWVNPSLAIINQLPHNDAAEWPTNAWPENLKEIDDEGFSTIIHYTFSDNSHDELGRTNALLIIQDGSIVYERSILLLQKILSLSPIQWQKAILAY